MEQADAPRWTREHCEIRWRREREYSATQDERNWPRQIKRRTSRWVSEVDKLDSGKRTRETRKQRKKAHSQIEHKKVLAFDHIFNFQPEYYYYLLWIVRSVWSVYEATKSKWAHNLNKQWKFRRSKLSLYLYEAYFSNCISLALSLLLSGTYPNATGRPEVWTKRSQAKQTGIPWQRFIQW